MIKELSGVFIIAWGALLFTGCGSPCKIDECATSRRLEAGMKNMDSLKVLLGDLSISSLDSNGREEALGYLEGTDIRQYEYAETGDMDDHLKNAAIQKKVMYFADEKRQQMIAFHLTRSGGGCYKIVRVTAGKQDAVKMED